MSSFAEVLPWRNSNLWKGVGLGVTVSVLATLVMVTQIGFHKVRPALTTESDYYSRGRGGDGGGGGNAMLASLRPGLTLPEQVHAEGPQIVRKAELDLLVADCAATQKKVEQLAKSESGFIEASTLQDSSATVILRVPSARLDAVQAKLRELAMRVNRDSVAAEDVSKQYYDREAHLRNLRAQEQQFLGIMKNAHSVPDVLEVTKSLDEVREQIDQEEGEFRRLKDQVEMSRIDVRLQAQSTSGVHWSLGSSTRSAVNDLLGSLAGFGDFVIWLVINIPLIVLWIAIIFVLVAAGWYVLRAAIRMMKAIFGRKSPAA